MTTLNLKKINARETLTQTISVLKRGGMIVYPTETVYGLGVDATNQEAVDKLLKFKGQRGLKPILIAVSDQKMAEEYIELNDVARRLYETFLPGPVAIVSRLNDKGQRLEERGLAKGVPSPDGTVGIRIPDYPLVLKIIKTFGRPITSTSANISGARNPWSIQDILDTTPKEKLGLIDLVLNTGALPKREPSAIVDTSREKTEIVREGTVDVRSKLTGQRSKTHTFISNSPQETMHIAKDFLKEILQQHDRWEQPLLITLQGSLGAGKTVFTKGIAQDLGIIEPIRSPSYMLIREYLIMDGTLFHIDAWRLHSAEEFQDLGLDKLLKRGNVVIVEWIERLTPILKELQKKAKIVFVEIKVIEEKRRKIIVSY